MLKNIVKAGLVVVMLALAIPASSEAAKAPKLSSTKVTLTVGKSKIITVKNTTKKVKWKNSAKGVVKVKKVSPRKVKITAKKKGTAKVTATVDGKKLTCKVTVKAKSTSATTTMASSKGTGSSNSSVTVTDAGSSGTGITTNTTTGDTGTTGSTGGIMIEGTFIKTETGELGNALADGDTITLSMAEGYGYIIGVTTGSIEDLSFEITNNDTANGKPAITVGLVNRDMYGGYDYFLFVITAIRTGSADVTLTTGDECITLHVKVEGTNNNIMNYTDVLLAMMETPLGESAEVTLEGEFEPTTTVTIDGVDTVYENSATITVDGVKGANDVETLLNLGAWIVDNKSYRYGSEDDVDEIPGFTYFFFREWAVGSDCAGLNTITEDAACLLGYTAWQYNSSGHLITMAVIDGQVYNFDSGGSGSAGVRGLTGGSLTLNADGSYVGPSIGYSYYGTYPNRKWEVSYDIVDANNSMTKVATEKVTALSDLTRPLPWYGDSSAVK